LATNPYSGITYDKRRGKWKAQRRVEGKVLSLGYYVTQEEAYQAIQAAPKPAPATELMTNASVQATAEHNRKKQRWRRATICF